MLYLINFSILSIWSYISCFFNYHLLCYLIQRLYIFKDSKIEDESITWLDIYLAILSLLGSYYLLPLSNQNQSAYLFLFHISIEFMINKEKKLFSVLICVCCIMSCSEIFLSQGGVFQHSTGCSKIFFLSPTMVATLGKCKFNFLI